MPATPAHIAAILPFAGKKRWLLASPLVVGSIAPDFGYFVFLPGMHQFAHSPAGLLLLALPAGLLLLWLYHAVIKRFVVLILPEYFAFRLWRFCGPFPFGGIKRFLTICAMVVLGSLTHVAWDAVTHREGWAVQRFPILDTLLCDNYSFPAFRVVTLLQLVSSAVGLMVVTLWCAWWLRHAVPSRPPRALLLPLATRWLLVTALATVTMSVGSVAGYIASQDFLGSSKFYVFSTHAFICGASAGFWTMFFLAVTWALLLRRGQKADLPYPSREGIIPRRPPGDFDPRFLPRERQPR